MDEKKLDIRALADLARLDVSSTELLMLEKEIPDILKFVEQIKRVKTEAMPSSPELHNVMRKDTDPHESGIFTEALLQATPKHKNDRIVVKQVVSRKETKNKKQ